MPEQENTQIENEQNPQDKNGSQDLVDALAEVKANTVPKDEYEALQAEHKKLIKAYINGEEYQVKEGEVETKDIEELRKELAEEDITNLEYCKRALALRNKCIEEGQIDPFLPTGYKIAPTDDDVQKAENVATILQECIDYADGDSQLFTNELQRRMIDAMPLKPKTKK